MKHIFFVGIGGKGLNGIAKICLEKGYKVSGVDIADKREIDDLREIGAVIYNQHKMSNITKDIDMLVYSSLINKNCPEIIEAKIRGIKMIKRAEFLEQLTKDSFRISISGSHGKSTTTALVGLSLINANIDATIFGGAYTKELHGYNHLGKSKYSVIEACEYDRSFHRLIGNISIITSIEKGHLEYYKDEAEMDQSFGYFFKQHDRTATIIANGDSLKIRQLTSRIEANVVYFGFDSRNDYVIDDVSQTQISSIFSLVKNAKRVLNQFEIKIPGIYNIYNFISAAVLLDQLGVSMDGVIETAKNFTGVGRRFEITQFATSPIFIDDFAHHPTQVRYLFDGIRQFYPTQKTCAVFQPRQFNLMKNFLKEYGESFKKADEIIITDIIPSLNDNEEDMRSITSSDLAKSIKKHSHKPVKLINSFPEIVAYIKEKYDQNSVVTTIGTGDIWKVRDQFLETVF